MFASPAFAQATSAAKPDLFTAFMQSGGPMILMIGAIFYFLILRPQSRRVKQHKDMIAAVKKNDVAITSGGLIGKVTKVDENEVELEIAQGVRVKIVKSMLSDIRPHGTKPAND